MNGGISVRHVGVRNHVSAVSVHQSCADLTKDEMSSAASGSARAGGTTRSRSNGVAGIALFERVLRSGEALGGPVALRFGSESRDVDRMVSGRRDSVTFSFGAEASLGAVMAAIARCKCILRSAVAMAPVSDRRSKAVAKAFRQGSMASSESAWELVVWNVSSERGGSRNSRSRYAIVGVNEREVAVAVTA